MSPAEWIAVAVVASVFWGWTGFLVLPAGRRLWRESHEGAWVPHEAVAIAGLLIFVGVPSDILYNLTIGTVRFREFPIGEFLRGNLTYTSRIKRLVRHRDPADARFVKALRWAKVLNIVDPGHVDIPA